MFDEIASEYHQKTKT